MNDAFYIALNFFSGANLLILFISATAMVLAVSLTLSLLAKKGKFIRGKSITYACLGITLFVSFIALALLNVTVDGVSKKLFFPLIFLAVCSVAFIPVKLSMPKPKFKKEQLDLARLIDGGYKSRKTQNAQPVVIESPKNDLPESSESGQNFVNERELIKPTERIIVSKKPDAPSEVDIDFTHVKNVIDRLDYFNLAPSDKRVVNELSANLRLAENGEFTPDIKGKINDGLGLLLKIMSKYGV